MYKNWEKVQLIRYDKLSTNEMQYRKKVKYLFHFSNKFDNVNFNYIILKIEVQPNYFIAGVARVCGPLNFLGVFRPQL